MEGAPVDNDEASQILIMAIPPEVAQCTSSGNLTASSVVYTRPCIYMGSQMNTLSATGTITVYNSASATSTASKVVDITVEGVNNTTTVSLQNGTMGVLCNSGIYITLAGVGATAIVYYIPL